MEPAGIEISHGYGQLRGTSRGCEHPRDLADSYAPEERGRARKTAEEMRQIIRSTITAAIGAIDAGASKVARALLASIAELVAEDPREDPVGDDVGVEGVIVLDEHRRG